MEPAFREQLIRLSADFYSFHAASFDESRHNGWDTWGRIWCEVKQIVSPATVLDLGCGNGRFVPFLESQTKEEIDYLGIDSDEQLIERARVRYPDKQFAVETLDAALAKLEDLDLIVCLGVFHHLPGEGYRHTVLENISKALAPGGVAVISLWQPKSLANFASKVAKTVNTPGLEPNDYLLGWKGDFSYLRYCHHFDDDEIDRLMKTSSLDLVTQFQGTGNDATNRYLILTTANEQRAEHLR